jgi:hypothetical protein
LKEDGLQTNEDDNGKSHDADPQVIVKPTPRECDVKVSSIKERASFWQKKDKMMKPAKSQIEDPKISPTKEDNAALILDHHNGGRDTHCLVKGSPADCNDKSNESNNNTWNEENTQNTDNELPDAVMIVDSPIKSTGISEKDESLPNFCDPSNESTSKEGDLQTNKDDNRKSHNANPQPHTSAINHDETERVHEKASNNNDSAIDNDGGEWDFEDDIGCVSVNMFGEIAYTDPADRITITIKPW